MTPKYLTPSAFGKILSKTMGPNKFCRWLLDNNFAFRNGQGKIIPMQDAVNRGILSLTERIDPAGKIRPHLLARHPELRIKRREAASLRGVASFFCGRWVTLAPKASDTVTP